MLVDGTIVTAGEKRRIHNGLFGVRTYDSKRSDPGFTLFSPSWGDRAYLVDQRGLVVHSWPVIHSNVAELHSDGRLFTHNCGNWLEEIEPDGSISWRWNGEEWMLQPNHHDYAWVSPDEIYSLCSFHEPAREGMYRAGEPRTK